MKLLILDGNSIVNRAFYGVRILTTRTGEYTNAIFGFLNILERLQKEEQPDALCVAFDLKGPTFRHKRYDGYKATRHPMPEELAAQMPVLKEILTAMRIPMYACEGWEADDVIGTVSRICTEEGWSCVISTGDRDSLQLVSDSVTVRLASTKPGQKTDPAYTPLTFREEYGFDPVRLIDLKALMGDSSDNIPGVPGVGEKTGKDLLLSFGTLDGVYAALDGGDPKFKGALLRKMQEGRQSAYLSYELATIRRDAPIDFTPEQAYLHEPDNDALYALFLRLELLKFIERYRLHAPQTAAAPVKEFTGECYGEEISDPLSLAAMLARFAKEEKITVLCSDDLSLTAVDGCGQMSWFCEKTLGKDYEKFLRNLFSGKCRILTHDCKVLARKLTERGLPAEGFVFDTAVAAYLLDATVGHYELERLTVQYLGFEMQTLTEKEVPEPAASFGSLAIRTASVTALEDVLAPMLKEQGMDALFREIELPLCGVLAQMESDGILIDRMALTAFGNALSEAISRDEQIIYDYAGGAFNINSTLQLGDVLFEKLNLPHGKKNARGYSTNAETLEKLRDAHPIVPAILDYRMLSKLNSTYAEGLLKVIGEDDRVHTTFQNTVTATGRLSSTDPNLQNIPVRTEMGSEIRKMFIPQPGWVLVDADYSQIELRVLAHIADDAAMQEAFRSGADFHTATAAQIFGVAPEAVTPLMRRNAKAVNFGIVYGISEFSLSEDLGISRTEAKNFINAYLARFSGVAAYMERIRKQAYADGFVTTLYGRRRAIPELTSKNYMVRMGAERIALNTPIQGTAADIMKIATVRAAEALKNAKLKARILLQVHDELIVECPEAEKERVREIITREMENAAQLSVPLLVEAKSGESWYAAK